MSCVVREDDCNCECHRTPGMIHVMPCCDKPPKKRKQDYYPDVSIPVEVCPTCKKFRGDEIETKIYHDNGHMWPGYAGDPR